VAQDDNMTYAERTPAERFEIATYGCTIPQMREAIEEGLNTGRHKDSIVFAKSLISDAQDEMAPDDIHDAYQTLNRALYVLTYYC